MLQALASSKARKSDFHPECLEPQKSSEVRPEMSECKAEESYPASIDLRYGSEVEFSCGNWGGNSENALSAILNDQESHVSARPMEQRVSREMEHTNSFHPLICPRDLLELETDMWGSGAQELDIGVEIELAVQQFMGFDFEEQCDDEDRMDSLWMDGDAYSTMKSCKESGDQRDHEERKSEKLRPPSLALESIPSRPNGELTVETKFDVIKYLASSLEPIWGSTFEKTKALGLASEVVPDVEIELDGCTHKKHKQINKEDVPDPPITSPHALSPS